MTTTGSKSYSKSMSSLIDITDGAGAEIVDGNITATNITATNTITSSLNVSGSGFINNLTVGTFTFVTEIFGKYQFVDFVLSGIDTISTTYYSVLDNVKNISFGGSCDNISIGSRNTGSTTLLKSLTNTINNFQFSGSRIDNLVSGAQYLFANPISNSIVIGSSSTSTVNLNGNVQGINVTTIKASTQVSTPSLSIGNSGGTSYNSLDLGTALPISVNIGSHIASTINIGSVTGRTGTINIGSGGSDTNDINIQDDLSSTGRVSLKSFRFTLDSIVSHPTNITNALSLFNTQSGKITLGTLNGITQIASIIISGQNIVSQTLTTAFNLFTTHTGLLNIGSSASAINLGGSATTGINLGNTTTGTITIGNATNTNKIGGISIINDGFTSATGNINLTPNTLNINPTNLLILNQSFRYVARTTYTPSLVTGTCVNLFGSYSVVGDTMHLRIWGNCLGAGSAGSGTYGFGIPSGYQIATNPFTTTPTLSSGYIISAPFTTNNPGGTIVGSGMISNLGVDIAVISVIPYNTTNICIYTSFSKYQSSGAWNFNTSNIHFCYQCTLPLV